MIVVGDDGVEPKHVEAPDLEPGTELTLRGWVWLVEGYQYLDKDSEGNPGPVLLLRPLSPVDKIIVEGS